MRKYEENDKIIIPKEYYKMSLSEIRKAKEKAYNDFRDEQKQKNVEPKKKCESKVKFYL